MSVPCVIQGSIPARRSPTPLSLPAPHGDVALWPRGFPSALLPLVRTGAAGGAPGTPTQEMEWRGRGGAALWGPRFPDVPSRFVWGPDAVADVGALHPSRVGGADGRDPGGPPKPPAVRAQRLGTATCWRPAGGHGGESADGGSGRGQLRCVRGFCSLLNPPVEERLPRDGADPSRLFSKRDPGSGWESAGSAGLQPVPAARPSLYLSWAFPCNPRIADESR